MKIIFEGKDFVKKDYIIERMVRDGSIKVSGFLIEKVQKSEEYKSFYLKDLNDNDYDTTTMEKMMVGKLDYKGNRLSNPEIYDLFGVSSILNNIRKDNLIIMESVHNFDDNAEVFKEVAEDLLNSSKTLLFITDDMSESFVKNINLKNDVKLINFDREDFGKISECLESIKNSI